MAQNTRNIEALIEMVAKFPGLGPRSSSRLVLYLLKRRAHIMKPFAALLDHVAQAISECHICGNLTEDDECHICSNPERNNGKICVVEDIAALWAMERTMIFKGRYHILGGTLSALDDIGPEELAIPQLLERITRENIDEIIIALGATIEGQTTAHYIAKHIDTRTKVTSLAQGVPIGGALEFLDDGTISAALSERKILDVWQQ